MAALLIAGAVGGAGSIEVAHGAAHAASPGTVAVPPSPTSSAPVASVAPSEEPVASPSPSLRPAPVPAVRPVPAPIAPSPSVVHVLAPVGGPAPSAPAATAATACPSTWFCYPRLAIAGQIVAYTDCTGRTDVGTQIRSFSCLSDRYLMGHAYTSFGRIAGWSAGDAVIADGVTYHVTGAFQQAGCTEPVLPLAPLTMQTSLTSSACGPVLIVQAR